MAWSFEQLGRAFAVVLACVLCTFLLTSPRPAGAAEITVFLDEAKLVKLPERITTIVIGNPLIADATVQAGGLMVITGKGYGTTNLIALDRAGVVLMEKSIEVLGPQANVVLVYRGIERESYSCTPDCERRINLGDSTAYFDAVIGQTVLRNGLAQGNPLPAK